MSRYEEEAKSLLSGDEMFIEKLYQDVFPSISKLVRRNSGNESDAEDIFQDALTTTYRKLRDGELILDCSLKTFIYSVSRNMWLHKLRGSKKQLTEPDLTIFNPVSDENIEKATEEAERKSLYFKYFGRLDKDCKRILELFFKGTSMDDIAIKMQYNSTGYARKKKFKCKEKLMDWIQNDPVYVELRSLQTKEINHG